MKPAIPHPQNPRQLRALTEAMFRIQRRDHKLYQRRHIGGAFRFVLWVLTYPFRSTRPEPLLVGMCAVYLGCWAIITFCF